MMMDILSTDDYELCSKLKTMEELLRDPNSDLMPFREKVGRLVGCGMGSALQQEAEPLH